MATKKKTLIRTRKAPAKRTRMARFAMPATTAPNLGDLRELSNFVNLVPPQRRIPIGAKGVEDIRQNAILKRLARNWNESSLAQRKQILNNLVQLRQLSDAQLDQAMVQQGLADGTLKGAVEAKHAAGDWFGRYFGGPVARIVLEGMIVGAARALEAKLPVEMYWVAGAGSDVRVAIAESAYQVTFLLMTPPRPAKRTLVRTLRDPEPLWVVSARGKRVQVKQVFPTALVQSRSSRGRR